MQTTTPPPSELPFGARVHAAFTKFDGGAHWEYDLVVLGVDEYGVWVGGAPGGWIRRPGREFISDAWWVNLYPHAGLWVATINDTGGTFSSRIYVDVTSAPSWWHRPDGTLSVSCIDLDLDVIKKFTGEVFVDDEDEFEEHRVRYGYPPEVVDGARRTTDWLYHHIRRLDEPFDQVVQGWLDVCRASVVSDERGRAVLVPGATAPAAREVADPGARPYGALPADGLGEAEGTVLDEDGEEDFLAVWSDQVRTPRREDEVVDDGPVVEVEHGHSHGHGGGYDADAPDVSDDVAGDFEGVDDIDLTPVDPAEVTGLLLTTGTGRESPLWFDGRAVEPEDVGLPGELADHLRDWSDRWNRDFDPDRGWRPQARIADYEALGEWLGRRVKDAVDGTRVWVQSAHLGRSGLHEIPPAAQREPLVVALDVDAPGDLPVVGDFVTLQGMVGCFSAETNTRLTEWAEAGGLVGPEEEALRDLMGQELGPDYRVH